MFALVFRNFVRSGGVKIGLLFLLAAGVASLLVGRQFIDRQRQMATEARAVQRNEFVRTAAVHADDLGLLLYYLKFSLVNETVPLSSLVIGQRDVNPSIQSVTIRALEAQKYDADLTNPTNLLLGNLDFSFVLIYLFPLLIIAFTYNIISEERENGTWRIVAVQSTNLVAHIRQLFAVRVAVVLGVLGVISGLAIPWLGIPPDGAFWAFIATSVLYLLFWFSVCFWVASQQQSSSDNAILLVAIWLGLIVILPAAVNNYIVTRYPVPEALATTLKQRKGYHEKWDMDKRATVEKFYAHYPQFRQNPPTDTPSEWRWYYAMQQLGDDESARESADLRAKLGQREAASRMIAHFIPTLHTQLQLNELARSGLGNQLRFLDETTRFHEKIRLYFYPKIFSNAPVKAEKWADFPVDTFRDDQPIDYAARLLPLLAFIGLFAGMSWVRLRRTLYQL
ncbi:DUF3526 domain-containing protein [Spirosoma arcticum]